MPHCCLSKSTWSKWASDSSASKAPSSRAPLALSARLASSSRLCSSAHIWPMSSASGLRSRAWSRSSSSRERVVEDDRARTAGRPTRSRRAAGPGRSGRRPGRRRAASRSRWRRRRRRGAGTSTPSDTMRTATIQRSSLAPNVLDALAGAEVVGEHDRGRLAGERARGSRRTRAPAVWFEAMTSPPASGDVASHLGEPAVGGRAAPPASTRPSGSSAVRQACAMRSLVIGSPSRAASSSPALVRQRMLPRVGQEEHRPHDAVAQRVGVAVRVVGWS